MELVDISNGNKTIPFTVETDICDFMIIIALHCVALNQMMPKQFLIFFEMCSLFEVVQIAPSEQKLSQCDARSLHLIQMFTFRSYQTVKKNRTKKMKTNHEPNERSCTFCSLLECNKSRTIVIFLRAVSKLKLFLLILL